MIVARRPATLRQLASITTAVAVTAFWFTLYHDLPAYPPTLGWPLALAGGLFLCVVGLLYRMHGTAWPGLACFGFIVSAAGLGSWIAGGALNALGAPVTDAESVWGRFAQQLISRPQPGWGMFNAGLIPIGLAAIRSGLSRSLRFLLPLGGLFLLGSPLKYVLGERTGGVAVLVAFGLGWLAIAALLWFEDAHPSPSRVYRSSGPR